MESRPSIPAEPADSEPTASVADDLPELYREILDRVAHLERTGAREEAGRIRVQATRAYSAAWDEAARRVLLGLIARADRTATPPARPRGWSIRRRSTSSAEPAR
jgi:hypothetical protein